MTVPALSALGPEDLQRINGMLEAFVEEAGARCGLLLDRSGRSVTASGDVGRLDETSFASLAAADFAASDQLAGLLGEPEFTSLYHQGINGSMYLVDVAGEAILAAVFDGRTTLGMVRLKTKEIVPRIGALLGEVGGRAPVRSRLEEGWTDEAVSEIDRLFAG